MTVRQWLYRAFNLNLEIEQLKDTYRTEYERATNTVPTLTGDSVTSTKDPHKNDNLLYVREQIDSMIALRLNVISDLLSVIETVENMNERMILRYRFILAHSWQAISDEMNYSERQTFRIYNSALKAVRPAVERKMLSYNVSK